MTIDIIKNNLNNCLVKTDIDLPNKYVGKVRDMYFMDDKVLLVSTDRQSAFDRLLGAVPFKGQVLNTASAWWFDKTKHIVKNHFIAMPDANCIVAKKCKLLPIEFVVRGYITGTTSTSLWTQYANGIRNYCGVDLADGYHKNQKLPENILTPTTKEADHDRPISPTEIVSQGWLTQQQWDFASSKALELFAFGQAETAKKGLILVDTKYEFGVDETTGDIILIDEIHTPDSSRFWIADTYQQLLNNGQEPDSLDKEFFRLWFAKNCDPYNDKTIPNPPEDLVCELSEKYIQQYEMITGEQFIYPNDATDINNRITTNITNYFNKVGKK